MYRNFISYADLEDKEYSKKLFRTALNESAELYGYEIIDKRSKLEKTKKTIKFITKNQQDK